MTDHVFSMVAVMEVSQVCLWGARDQPKILVLLGKHSTTKPCPGPDEGLGTHPSRALTVALLGFGYVSVSRSPHFFSCAVEITTRTEGEAIVVMHRLIKTG